MSPATKSRHHRNQAISPKQIVAIHATIHKLGLDDVAYRARLKVYGAHSCKDLTWQQADELLSDLTGITSQPRKHKGKQYADLDGRPGFASGAQLRLIAAMFSQVTVVPADDQDGREKALNSFCQRITHVAGLRMVRTYQVEKIVKALEAMGAEHKEKGGSQ